MQSVDGGSVTGWTRAGRELLTATFQPRAGPRTVLRVEGLNLLSGYGEAGVNTGSSSPGAADARSAWTGQPRGS